MSGAEAISNAINIMKRAQELTPLRSLVWQMQAPQAVRTPLRELMWQFQPPRQAVPEDLADLYRKYRESARMNAILTR